MAVVNNNVYINKGIQGLNSQVNAIPNNILAGTVLGQGSLNPGIIKANQLETLAVGAGVGQVKEALYQVAIRSTEYLYNNIEEGVFTDESFTNRTTDKSILGNYLFDNLVLKPCVFFQFKSNNVNNVITTEKTPVNFLGLRLDTAIINVNKENTIIETQTIGSKSGSIKEFMSSGEYMIQVRAYVTAENLDRKRLEYNVPALQQIGILSQCNQSIDIESYFLSLLGVSKVVVKSLNLTQVEGFSGVVELSLDLISDTELTINK